MEITWHGSLEMWRWEPHISDGNSRGRGMGVRWIATVGVPVCLLSRGREGVERVQGRVEMARRKE